VLHTHNNISRVLHTHNNISRVLHTHNYKSMLRHYFWGHFLFCILAFMALWFWQERTLILDAAFQSYLFIATGKPAVMVERFGAGLVQLLPLMFVYGGASLKVVLMAYSVSFVVYHWALFSFCLHILQDAKSALAILLFCTLLNGDCFYWIQNELLLGISLLLVLYALWRYNGTQLLYKLRLPLILLGAITVVYLHPLMIFPLSFLFGFEWLHEKGSFQEKATKYAPIAVTLILVFATKYLLRQPNFYDRGMTGQYVRDFQFSFPILLQSKGLQDFEAHLCSSMLLFFPVSCFILVYYILRKKWYLAGIFVLFNIGYLLLILQRYLNDDRWYIAESHYQCLAYFMILPLVWDVLPDCKDFAKAVGRPIISICIVLFFSFRLLFIFQNHIPYSTRLAYVSGLLQQSKEMQGRKFVRNEQSLNHKILLMNWGLPYETWQMSALSSPDSVRTIAVAENPDSLANLLSPDSMLTFLMIKRIAFKDMPLRYYRMDDGGAYKVLESK
jgi:hypothetical protein